MCLFASVTACQTKTHQNDSINVVPHAIPSRMIFRDREPSLQHPGSRNISVGSLAIDGFPDGESRGRWRWVERVVGRVAQTEVDRGL